MKKYMNRFTAAARKLEGKTIVTVMDTKEAWKKKLTDDEGQFVVDHAVVFVLIIVLGGISLVLLKNFLSSDLAPTLKNKILEFFN